MGWTKESVYDEQIAPLISRVIAICKEHKIPAAATFQYEDDDENGPGFVSTCLPFDDVQSKHMARVQHLVASPEPAHAVALTVTSTPTGSVER